MLKYTTNNNEEPSLNSPPKETTEEHEIYETIETANNINRSSQPTAPAVINLQIYENVSTTKNEPQSNSIEKKQNMNSNSKKLFQYSTSILDILHLLIIVSYFKNALTRKLKLVTFILGASNSMLDFNCMHIFKCGSVKNCID